jgi:hypothetical protein
LWEPLCYAQIGGLTLATGITLFLVPILYAVFVVDLKWVKWKVDFDAMPTNIVAHPAPHILQVPQMPNLPPLAGSQGYDSFSQTTVMPSKEAPSPFDPVQETAVMPRPPVKNRPN